MASIHGDLMRLKKQNFEPRDFISWPQLKTFMTRERVLRLLQESQVPFHIIERTIRIVLKDGIKTFSTLAWIGVVHSIENFIEADHYRGLLDARLHMSKEMLTSVLCSEEKSRLFFREQWMFLAPVLQLDQAHRRLDNHTILPFTESHNLSAGATGAFSEMSKVTVDADHHRIPHTGEKLSIVCKRVIRQSKGRTLEETFRHECDILSALRCLRHPNIINLITAYTKGETFTLLFPTADGDLHKFCSLQERPLGFESDRDVLAALWGLSSAIQAVHDYWAKIFDVRKIGLHYDIKPRNILFRDNRFILSDFGISNLREVADGSVTKFRLGEGDFLAPECEPAEQGYKPGLIGRASDIWSFGCVLAVMLAYLMGGCEGVANFENERKVKLGMSIESVFHKGTMPNPAVENFLRRCMMVRDDRQGISALAYLISLILRIAPEKRPGAAFITARVFYVANCHVVKTIAFLFDSRMESIDFGFEVELRRLLVWSDAVGLRSELAEIKDDAWIAGVHSYDEYHTVQENLERCSEEIQAILEESHSIEKVTYNRYYHLQRLVDRLWDTQPALVQSRMASEIETSLLDSSGHKRLQEIQRVFGTKNDEDQATSNLEAESKELFPSIHAYRKIGLFALMKQMSLTLSEGSDLNSSLMIDRTSIARLTKFHSHFLSSTKDDGFQVLVEKMVYSASWETRTNELLKRISDIASLRTCVTSSVFPVLQCRGYYHDSSRLELGLVYDFPSESQDAKPMSLKDVMEHGSSRTKKPSLTNKFRLASVLTSSILGLHKAGWLHKNICSFNIIFFPKDAANPSPSINAPYIIGFNYSRSNKETAFTDGPNEIRKYHHPVYIRNSRSVVQESEDPRKRFREEFEYYSLGLVLLEIGLWTPLSTIIKKIPGSPEDVRVQLLGTHISLLKTYMGDAYAEAVKVCLEAYSDHDEPTEKSRVAFEEYVVRPIRERRI